MSVTGNGAGVGLAGAACADAASETVAAMAATPATIDVARRRPGIGRGRAALSEITL